jgi:hypothetical protein
MSEQLAPEASQRRHWYAWVIVGEPVQVPLEAVSVSPCSGVPEMTGRALFATGMAVTTALWALVALWSPTEFVAVTATRTVAPMSVGVRA